MCAADAGPRAIVITTIRSTFSSSEVANIGSPSAFTLLSHIRRATASAQSYSVSRLILAGVLVGMPLQSRSVVVNNRNPLLHGRTTNLCDCGSNSVFSATSSALSLCFSAAVSATILRWCPQQAQVIIQHHAQPSFRYVRKHCPLRMIVVRPRFGIIVNAVLTENLVKRRVLYHPHQHLIGDVERTAILRIDQVIAQIDRGPISSGCSL